MTAPSDPPPPESGRVLRWFRRSFLAGVAIVLPLAVTLWLVVAFVGLVDNNVLPLLPGPYRLTAERIPGAGIMVAITALTALGALAGNFLGRAIIQELDDFVARVPFIRSIYGGTKQVFKQVAAPEQRSFKDAVLVEFPHKGYWTIGFVTNTAPDLVEPDLVAVYVPQAPIPTTGFLIYAPRAALKPLSVGPEEALKRVISLGSAQDAAATTP
ncbi:MAG: DUF502 domain-containing protein [Hyphomonadaceae bacterium]|nr:DUF502 domain-containing protein [Hyphomonadaceae bacterium]